MTPAPSARAHAPFAVANRVVNPVVKWLLVSPAHGLVSPWLCLLTVTGRKTGRAYTFPVGYRRDGDTVQVSIALPDRKRWWRNLIDEAPVQLVLGGERATGRGVAIQNDRAVTVSIRLDP